MLNLLKLIAYFSLIANLSNFPILSNLPSLKTDLLNYLTSEKAACGNRVDMRESGRGGERVRGRERIVRDREGKRKIDKEMVLVMSTYRCMCVCV